MGAKLCTEHGLHFDPETQAGCVRCRRAGGDAGPSRRSAGLRIVVLLVVGAAAIGAMSVWVRRANEEAALHPTVRTLYDPATSVPLRAPSAQLVELAAPAPPIVRVPQGAPPAAGWPVMVLLHGTGGSGDRFLSFAEAANDARFAAVVLTGPVMVEPGRFGWPDDVDAIERYVAKLTETATTSGGALSRGRVVIGGYSTGAWLAIRLAAARPDRYSAVLAFAPVGPPRPLGQAVAGRVELRMFVGGEDEGGRSTAAAMEGEWRARGWPVHVISYDGGHALPARYREMLVANARAIETAP